MADPAAKSLVKFRVVGGPANKDVVDRVGYATAVEAEALVLVSKRPFPVETQIEIKLADRTIRGVVTAAGEMDDAGDFRLEISLAAPEVEAPGLSLFSDEKRRYVRKECKHFVRYRCVSKGVSRETEARSGVITDLAKGGVRLRAVREYVVGCILELQMPEGIVGPKKATLYAKVCWRAAAEKAGEFTHGAMFVKLSEPPPADGI
jgi:hypothetical protein